MGKGIPLHHFLDSNTLLYLVEFKTGRTDICYIMQGDTILPEIGDLVITEADRGRDLGKVMNILTANSIIQKHRQQIDGTKATMGGLDMVTEGDGQLINENNDEAKDDEKLQVSQKCQVKRLYRLADTEETASLTTKQLDEEKALLVCQTKIQQKELPMQVVNAEYQWDRRKLTFYFMADQRIDFRELVRELFKTYKTRIWMCALKSNTSGSLSCE
ncbi:PSP1 C-terminal conserved region-domain-containing protein [Absidia repens]|uniref:PSP1 C-terminal conserved region-domain-containing protein n=1 Tax=Absidia repens TaxID=90262 RepID=A0A1X2I6K9_9FUNG|nr:PSP1 C-terminal conserved region-domain-containing protein [Absidia repens]